VRPAAGLLPTVEKVRIRVINGEPTVRNLDTTVAVYDDGREAETDWSALERAAAGGELELADAALVENRDREAVILHRQSRHGWGKGAVVGAVVGILFPPSVLGAAAVGAGAGAVVARLSRAFGRSDVKELGETLDSGGLAVIAVSPSSCTNTVVKTLAGARTTTTVPSATVEEIQEAVEAAPRPRRRA
jgi:uncharacterized membrane protein